MIATRLGDSGSCTDDEKTREFPLESRLLMELTGKAVRCGVGVRRSMKQDAILVMCHKISKIMGSRMQQESVLMYLSYLEPIFIDE
jgi:hypothetical protein